MDGMEAVLIASTSGEGSWAIGHYSRRAIVGDVAGVRENLKFAFGKQETLPTTAPDSLSRGQTTSLPLLSPQTAITEGTTELLHPLLKEEMVVGQFKIITSINTSSKFQTDPLLYFERANNGSEFLSVFFPL